MANIFVWSGATGLNDGTTWEDAFVKIGRDYGPLLTPGTDFVYIRDSHAESDQEEKTIQGSSAEGSEDPVRIICVVGNDTGTTPGNLSTTASVTTTTNTNIVIREKLYMYGIDFFTSNNIEMSTGLDNDITSEQCRYELTTGSSGDKFFIGGTGSGSSRTRFFNCDLDFAHAGQGFNIGSGRHVWDTGTLGFNVTNLVAAGPNRSCEFIFRNMDLSILSNNLFQASGANSNGVIRFERCLFHASTTLVSGNVDQPGMEVTTHLCQSSTDSDPAYQMKKQVSEGTVEVDTARYRTGGATDSERTNPYSWNMSTSLASNVIEIYEPLESPPIGAWTTGDGTTAHTYRIFVASGATRQDDDTWVRMILPNNNEGTTLSGSIGDMVSTRLVPLGSATNLTTDSSSWTGADVGTVQYIDVTHTADKPGPVTARVYFAASSARLSIDPQIVIDP